MEELSGRRRFLPGLYGTVSFVTSSRGTGAPTGISVYEIIIIFSKVVRFRARRQLIATSYEPLVLKEIRRVLSEEPGSTDASGSGS